MIRTVFLRAMAFLLSLGSVVCPAAASEALAGICITEVPEKSLMLEGRYLRQGDVLTAEQLGRVMPEGEEALTVGYLPIYEDRVGENAEMTLSLKGRENKAPMAEDQTLETYKNLPNSAQLKVHDPEEEPMTYTLVRQPRRGTLEIREDGTFTYTPKKNKVGIDSFTYTAADPAGKTSREATVTVTILKPSDAARYTDTVGKDCRFAAEWMRHTGIFVGEQVGQEPCFGPEKPVTAGEFVTMVVKTLEIPTDTELVSADFEEAPVWLQPYLTAAVRAGLTAGVPAFAPEDPITGIQAAVMLENAVDAAAFGQLTEEPLTRGQAAVALYEAAKLKESRKMDTVI